MAQHRNRRKVRKRKGRGENSGMKIAMIIGIMLMAVLLGYVTAKFVIGPILGYNADESPIRIAEKSSDDQNAEEGSGSEKGNEKETAEKGNQDQDGQQAEDVSKEGKIETDSVPDEGYALQFGVFSTKEAAEEMAAQLLTKGIETKIIEADNMYKVISPVIKTKDEALTKLDEAKNQAVEDVFIASF